MEFCPVCSNMYYIRLAGESENKLVYYCRKCGNEADESTADLSSICVSKTHIRKSKATFDHLINEYTKLDPTLPTAKDVPCPNAECPAATGDGEGRVIYLRYDDANMRFVYICTACDTVWKNAES